MNKRFFVFGFVLLFLLVSTATAQQQGQPFQQIGDFTEGLTISFPLFFLFEQSKDIAFNFHVYNATGHIIDNTSTNCLFHLYTRNGSHIINNQELGFDVTGNDFEYIVSGNNFTELGDYAFLINCNNSQAGGFESHLFQITADGISDTPLDNSAGVGVVIFLTTILMALFILPFKTEFFKTKWLNELTKKSIWAFAFVMLALVTAMITTIIDTANIDITSEMLMIVWVCTKLSYLMAFYMIVKWFFDLIEMLKLKKNNRRMGNEE